MEFSTLSKLYALDGPFTTIYLDTTSEVEDAAERLEIRWKNVVGTSSSAGVDPATIKALNAARGDHTGGNTRVLVAAHGVVHLAISLPQPPAAEEVVTSQLPRLAPLVDALGMQLPHVVVLADRHGADILAYTAGPDPDETASVTNDRFPSRKVHAGGWAAKRYDNDVEESWEASARDVAAMVDRVAQDVGARVVIASGDERALQLLGQHLPTALIDRFVAVDGGGRHDDGSDEVIAGEVMRILTDTLAAGTVELLERFSQERGQESASADRVPTEGGGRRAADGVDAVVAALRQGQVDTLILTDARDRARTAFLGPDPTHLALTAEDLLDLGVEQPWEATLEEILIRAALGTGAEVRFVGGGTEQAPADGVGALLRYSG